MAAGGEWAVSLTNCWVEGCKRVPGQGVEPDQGDFCPLFQGVLGAVAGEAGACMGRWICAVSSPREGQGPVLEAVERGRVCAMGSLWEVGYWVSALSVNLCTSYMFN